MERSIKELRKSARLTQAEMASLAGIPLRTYVNYENDPKKKGSIKYQYIIHLLEQLTFIDETHGILAYDDIVTKCSDIFDEYPVHFCYLFGSYAKGTATEKSDVDLLISTDAAGIRFYGLAERLREALKKNVDLINVQQLTDGNADLLNALLKEGIRFYVQDQRVLSGKDKRKR